MHYVVLVHACGNVFGNTRTEKFFDITGSVTYTTLTAVALTSASEALTPRQKLLAGMVLVWCVRLGGFLFLRIKKHGGIDPRFEKPKRYFSTFFTWWDISAVCASSTLPRVPRHFASSF